MIAIGIWKGVTGQINWSRAPPGTIVLTLFFQGFLDPLFFQGGGGGYPPPPKDSSVKPKKMTFMGIFCSKSYFRVFPAYLHVSRWYESIVRPFPAASLDVYFIR